MKIYLTTKFLLSLLPDWAAHAAEALHLKWTAKAQRFDRFEKPEVRKERAATYRRLSASYLRMARNSRRDVLRYLPSPY